MNKYKYKSKVKINYVMCRGGGNRKPGGRPVHSVESDDTSGLFIGTVFVGGINGNEWHTTLRLKEKERERLCGVHTACKY